MSDILIIEDDPNINKLVSRNLQIRSYDILSFDRAEIARDWLMSESPPKLIILDLKLGKLSGLDLLKLMNKNSHLREIPVFIITASVDIAESIEEEFEQVRHVMTKPIRLKELLISIEERMSKS